MNSNSNSIPRILKSLGIDAENTHVKSISIVNGDISIVACIENDKTEEKDITNANIPSLPGF